MYLIKSGNFKITKTIWIAGYPKEIDVGIIGKGELLGEEDVIEKSVSRTLNAVCVSSYGEIVAIPRKEFEDRLK